jgi:hypothetical protein
MRLSARGLNRATLGRQLLLQREAADVVDAVRRVVALQAQQPASPYLAMWNRLTSFDAVDLDTAFAEQTVVKATLMRITLHAVHVDDHPAMHAAMQPTLRGARLGDPRFTSTGLAAADADALVPDVLALTARPRTTPELLSWLEERTGVDPKGVWWALRSYTPVLHAPTGGPWSFGQRPSYVAARTPLRNDDGSADEALQTLARRYLEGFGPATVADLARFALVQRSRARAALQGLADELERFDGPDGEQLFDVLGALLPHDDTPAPPRLMAMWDSVLLAYADRSRLIPPAYRKVVIRVNGDVLPTLLVDGHVAGVWRAVEGGIEVSAFHRLADDDWTALTAEARSLLAFLSAREPRVYSRYDHWWAKLPEAAEVRLLTA